MISPPILARGIAVPIPISVGKIGDCDGIGGMIVCPAIKFCLVGVLSEIDISNSLSARIAVKVLLETGAWASFLTHLRKKVDETFAGLDLARHDTHIRASGLGTA